MATEKTLVERKDHVLINNRQAGRRNRGRSNNNGRPSGGNRGGGDNGNRIDNRSRGNAAQLLEKYRNMARDAQLAGDRVNAEYYLQFADHYFRVLADNRARQEEQQGRYRRPDEGFDDEGEDFGNEDGGDDFRFAQPERVERQDRQEMRAERQQGERTERQPNDRQQGERQQGDRQQSERPGQEGEARPRRDRNRRDRGVEATANEAAQLVPAPAPAPAATPEGAAEPMPAQEEASAPRRRGRPKKGEEKAQPQGLDLAVLPPSIARADNDSDDRASDVAEEAPRKRTRRTRPAAEAAE